MKTIDNITYDDALNADDPMKEYIDDKWDYCEFDFQIVMDNDYPFVITIQAEDFEQANKRLGRIIDGLGNAKFEPMQRAIIV